MTSIVCEQITEWLTKIENAVELWIKTESMAKVKQSKGKTLTLPMYSDRRS